MSLLTLAQSGRDLWLIVTSKATGVSSNGRVNPVPKEKFGQAHFDVKQCVRRFTQCAENLRY